MSLSWFVLTLVSLTTLFTVGSRSVYQIFSAQNWLDENVSQSCWAGFTMYKQTRVLSTCKQSENWRMKCYFRKIYLILFTIIKQISKTYCVELINFSACACGKVNFVNRVEIFTLANKRTGGVWTWLNFVISSQMYALHQQSLFNLTRRWVGCLPDDINAYPIRTMYRNFIPRLCSPAKWAAMNILVTLGWGFLTKRQKYRKVTLELLLDIFQVITTGTNIHCLHTFIIIVI